MIRFHSLGLTLLIRLVAREVVTLMAERRYFLARREVLTLIRFIFRLYRPGVAIIWELRWMIGIRLIPYTRLRYDDPFALLALSIYTYREQKK